MNSRYDQMDPQTLLFQSADTGDLTGVKHALDAGAHIDGHVNNTDELTALHLATQNNNIQMMKYLIRRNATVDMPSRTGVTPLMLAAQEGHAKAMQLLLKNGADPCRKDDNNAPVVFYAARAPRNTDEVLDALMADGRVSPKHLNAHHPNMVPLFPNDRKTPLYHAFYACVEAGDVSQPVAAFIRHGAEWWKREEDGQTPLHYMLREAARERNSGSYMKRAMAKIFKSVLEEGVDMFIEDSRRQSAGPLALTCPETAKVFSDHSDHCRALAESPHAAADFVDPEKPGKPSRLALQLCGAHVLGRALDPSHWQGRESELATVKETLAATLPEYYARMYSSLLDASALRRDTGAPRAAWQEYYMGKPGRARGQRPPEGGSRDQIR